MRDISVKEHLPKYESRDRNQKQGIQAEWETRLGSEVFMDLETQPQLRLGTLLLLLRSVTTVVILGQCNVKCLGSPL